jgi:hypothetical protein
MGLPAYQQGSQVDWRLEELAERWTEDFDIDLDELKAFLRHHKWPLPINFFPSEPDNSEAKVRLEHSEYTEGWEKLEELAAVELQIENWQSKTAATVEEELRKEARRRKLHWQHEHLKLWLDEYGPEESA